MTVEAPPFREKRETSAITGEKIPTIFINAHPGQTDVLNSTKRWILALAGLQSGKTCIGAHWLLREIQRRGEGDYLVVSSSYPLLEKKCLPEFKEVFIDLYDLGKYYESRKLFVSKDDSFKVYFGTADKASSLESSTAKAAWCDEAGQDEFTRAAWTAIRGRLSIAQGRCLFTTTIYNFGWLKTEFYDKWKQGDDTIDVIQFKSTMNPAFPVEEYNEQKKLLPKWLFDMRYNGEYSRPAGLVYDSFRSEDCIIPRYELPSHYPRFVGHDFGRSNTAAIWVAYEPDTGRFIVYRTYHGGGLSVPQHIAKFRQLSNGENIQRRVGGSHTEQEIRDGYALGGWPVEEPGDTKPHSQIMWVYSLHSQNKIAVFEDCHEYIDEKQSFAYELDDNYEPNTQNIENEAKYHLMAAERYLMTAMKTIAANRMFGQGERVIQVQRPSQRMGRPKIGVSRGRVIEVG